MKWKWSEMIWSRTYDKSRAVPRRDSNSTDWILVPFSIISFLQSFPNWLHWVLMTRKTVAWIMGKHDLGGVHDNIDQRGRFFPELKVKAGTRLPLRINGILKQIIKHTFSPIFALYCRMSPREIKMVFQFSQSSCSKMSETFCKERISSARYQHTVF